MIINQEIRKNQNLQMKINQKILSLHLFQAKKNQQIQYNLIESKNKTRKFKKKVKMKEILLQTTKTILLVNLLLILMVQTSQIKLLIQVSLLKQM